MPDGEIKATSDAYTSSKYGSKNYGGIKFMVLDTSGEVRRGFMNFSLPFNEGAAILSATLKLKQKGAATGGSRTLTVQRISSTWSESKITHNKQPTVAGATASVTLGDSSTDQREWVFDVKSIVDEVVNDKSLWFGLRVVSNNSTPISLYSRNSGDEVAPLLVIEYSNPPSTPSKLSPSSSRVVSLLRPKFRFDFTDVNTEDIGKAQVIASLSSTMSPLLFDSGEYATSVSEYTPSVDLPTGVPIYWQARVWNGSGAESDYSSVASFSIVAKPTVTITSATTFYEATPEFTWTVSGGTQTAFEVRITSTTDFSSILYSSGRITSADNSWTLPASAGSIINPNSSYGLVLRVWDDKPREAIPSDTPFVQKTQVFNVEASTAVDSPTNLTVTTPEDSPFAVLEWEHTGSVDDFVIYRDGKLVAADIDPSEASIGGGKYQYVDPIPKPYVETTWGVAAHFGNDTSFPDEVTGTVEPIGVWLVSLSGDNEKVQLWGADSPVTFEADETVVVHEPLNAPSAVVVTQSVRGRRGYLSAFVKQDDLDTWRLLTGRDRRGDALGMILSNASIQIIPFNIAEGVLQEFSDDIPVSFEFREVL